MSLDSAKKRIQNYLNADKGWPLLVDLQTQADIADIRDYFNIGDNKIIYASSFCGDDTALKTDELFNAIDTNAGNTFLCGVSAFLMLAGEIDAVHILRQIAAKSINGHFVVLTYQCKKYLASLSHSAFEKGQAIICDAEPDPLAEISFISPDLKNAFPGAYSGLEKIGRALEETLSSSLSFITNNNRNLFEKSVLSIHQMKDGYDILCQKDLRTKDVLPQNLGTAGQWNYALTKMGGRGNWDSVLRDEFGSAGDITKAIAEYKEFSDNRKWLYYLAVSAFHASDNEYLRLAADNSADYTELIKQLFRAILMYDPESKDFAKLYRQRKSLLKHFADDLKEISDFCKIVVSKGKNAVYYLTDNTQMEKEAVITWLSSYGQPFSAVDLSALLKTVYPDLAAYLSGFRFKKPFLTDYFERYKFQKLTNQILPDFEVTVDEQASQLDFVSLLPLRATVVDNLDVSNGHAYFVDALGAEYLGFIQTKCNEYGLAANIEAACCNLPSLTCFNKEFVEDLESRDCHVSDIKDLDEIKHHGEDNCDYEKVKTPVYLINELEIIDKLLQKIRAHIYGGHYEKEFILSDHGASRLAVLHETENLWQMETSGVHSGRCCPTNEINEKPQAAVDNEGFWILANYDRFKGSRKANVEVHGGATIEEVTVPIIEITRKPEKVEAFILDEYKTLTLGAKENAKIQLYVGVKIHSLTVLLDGKYYDAESTKDAYIYFVDMPDCTKKGQYSFDLLNGSNLIASNMRFEVKKKGMSENNLFGRGGKL